MRDECGYIAIQSTRPQTLAYGLVDSQDRATGMDARQIQGVDLAARGDARTTFSVPIESWNTSRCIGSPAPPARVPTSDTQPRPGDRHRNPPPHPPRSLNSHTTSASDRSPNASTTSNVGPTSTTADTSPPWKNPESSLVTSAHSSGACADHSALRTKTYVCVDIPVRESGRVEMQREVIRSSLCRADGAV